MSDLLLALLQFPEFTRASTQIQENLRILHTYLRMFKVSLLVVININFLYLRDLIFEESSLKSGEELPDNPADRRPYIVDDLIDRARRLCPFNEHFHCQFRFSSEDKFADHIQKWHLDRYDEVG